MPESISTGGKSRASTPQQEIPRPGIVEALQLLHKWNLPELQAVFKDHDISIRSLLYLTEDEICELIPKIGIRTIFRALLIDWRQTYSSISENCAAISSCYDGIDDDDSFLDKIELKTEYNSSDFDINQDQKDLYALKQLQQNPNNLNDENNNDFFSSEPLNIPPESSSLFHQTNKKFCPTDKFNVLEILQSSSEGQAILEFYKTNQVLDIKNRKRIVNLLIKYVVGQKIDKYTAIFHDITRQLLILFPTEKYETYFVPHSGPHSARGALYYRYSNYTRQLRKEGILAYKKPKSQKLTQ